MTLTKKKLVPYTVDGNHDRERDVSQAHSVALARVPDKSYVDRYINRRIGGYTDFEIYDYALINGQNVLLEGPTGPGKTMSVTAFAALKGLAFYSIPSNVGVEPSQMFGKYIPDEGVPGSFVWQDGGVTSIVRHGGVLLINEVNFMPDRVATALFGLLDGRREITLLDHRGEVVRAHRGADNDCWCGRDADYCNAHRILVVGDMNPDYSGTRPLNTAFRNRFAIQLNWDYDIEVESKLVKSKTLLTIVAHRIREGLKTGVYTTPVSTNMLMEFEKMAMVMGVELACVIFANHFASDERQSVALVLDGVMSNLQQELPMHGVKVHREEWTIFASDDDWVYSDRAGEYVEESL